MSSIIAIIILAICFAGMAVGLLARKNLKRGCSLGDDCTCKDKPVPPSPDECEHHQK